MASLLGKALSPRNEAPVPYVATRAGSAFSGNSASNGGPMGQMSQVSTLFAVVDRVCTAVQAPDWDLYRTPPRGSDAERELIEPERHAAANLWANPNPHMTQAALIEMVQQHIELSATGDGFLVVVKVGKMPVELWPVRPDRMQEVPHPKKFLAGWVYKSPDGDKIPLEVDEVIHIKGTPDPNNPYRGLGRVNALLRDLHGATAAAEYTGAFFANSAQPGGIIEVEDSLTDDEFNTLRQRWQEQHRGVRNAHRVAILEHGKWVDRSYSMRDLDMSALRNLSRDQIFEAWGISRATMGLTDGVNFAAAKAARAQMAEMLTEPRLERWKQALNSRLLPLFGSTGKGAEFDYESPVPGDADEENADRASKVAAVQGLVSAGFNPQSAAEQFGLPEIAFGDGQPSDPSRDLMVQLVTAAPAALAPVLLPILLPDVEFPEGFGKTQAPAPPEPPAPPTPPAPGEPVEPDPLNPPDDMNPDDVTAHTIPTIRAAADSPEPDLSPLAAAFKKALDALMAAWDRITGTMRVQIRKQIAQLVDDGDFAGLAQLSVELDPAQAAVGEAMVGLAAVAAAQAVSEGADAGVALTAASLDAADFSITINVTAQLLADEMTLAAGREAVRQATPGRTGMEVARDVDTVLSDRSTASAEQQLGGALHHAATEARAQTFASGPVGSLYQTAKLDGKACVNCAAANGRFICTTEDLGPYEKLFTKAGGYRECLGGIRCRCTVEGAWRPETDPNFNRETGQRDPG